MARKTIELEITTKTAALQTLYRSFPSLGVHILARIGKYGRVALKTKYLSGQEIHLKGGLKPRDKRGKYLISHRVLRGGKGVVWRSYPLNLFERVFRPRGVTKTPKKILTGKFAGYMRGRIGAFAAHAERQIIKKELDRV